MAILTPEDVRAFISDSVPNNKLLDDLEFTDARVNVAIQMTLSNINTTPPMSMYTVDDFPYFSTLMYGTLWNLFSGQVALKARNNLQYSDGGLAVPVEEQFPLYMNLLQYYEATFKQELSRIKISINNDAAWGAVGSMYSYSWLTGECL